MEKNRTPKSKLSFYKQWSEFAYTLKRNFHLKRSRLSVCKITLPHFGFEHGSKSGIDKLQYNYATIRWLFGLCCVVMTIGRHYTAAFKCSKADWTVLSCVATANKPLISSVNFRNSIKNLGLLGNSVQELRQPLHSKGVNKIKKIFISPANHK